MTDITPTRERPGKASAGIPFAQAPEAGKTLEVARGVFWIRMPLPMTLDHINIWALEDGDGWTIVDTGMRTGDTLQPGERCLRVPLTSGHSNASLARTCIPTTSGCRGG